MTKSSLTPRPPAVQAMIDKVWACDTVEELRAMNGNVESMVSKLRKSKSTRLHALHLSNALDTKVRGFIGKWHRGQSSKWEIWSAG